MRLLMIWRPVVRLLSFTFLIVGFAAALLHAQSARPSGEREVLALSLTAEAAVEDHGNGGGAADVRDPQFQGARITSTYQAGLAYNELQREHVGWQFNASTGLIRYETLHESLPTDQLAAGILALSFGKWTHVSVGERVAYLPNYSLAS